jgi:curli biogenesis system outer membrane secretion channel CsgG
MWMLLISLIATASLAQTANRAAAQQNVPPAPLQKQEANASTVEPAVVSSEAQLSLLRVKRIFVENFGDTSEARQIHAMVVNSLSASGRFIVTENREKADATLKGAALEKRSQEFHALSEGTAVATAAGSSSGSSSGSLHGSFSGGAGSVQGSSSGHSSSSFGAVAAATEDSSASTETVDNASLAVRLVAADGDVIWVTTQESKGAKYKGASADVADKIVKQLLKDITKLENREKAASAK